MAIYGNTITVGGVTLEVLSMTPTQKQKTIKQVVGKSLIQTKILGINAFQWELKITGIITSSLSTIRASIEGLNDLSQHTVVDGVHDGTYYLDPKSLSFEDTGAEAGQVFRYTMKLVQV